MPPKACCWAPAQAWGDWARRGLHVALGPRRRRLGRLGRLRRRRVALPQHGVLLEQAVETDHAGHRSAEGGRNLRRRRVHDGPGRLVRSLDRDERRAERGRDDRRRAAHRQQAAPRTRRPHGQPLTAEDRGDLRHLTRARAVVGGILRRGEVVAVVRRTRRGHRGDRGRQPGGVLARQHHVEVEDLVGGGRPELLDALGQGRRRLGQDGLAGLGRGRGRGRHGGSQRAGRQRRRAECGAEQRQAPPLTPNHESPSPPVPAAPSAPWGVGS